MTADARFRARLGSLVAARIKRLGVTQQAVAEASREPLDQVHVSNVTLAKASAELTLRVIDTVTLMEAGRPLSSVSDEELIAELAGRHAGEVMSDLREALEELIQANWVYKHDGVISPVELRELLAAHPVEPAAERATCQACSWEGDKEHDVCPRCGQDELNYFFPGSTPVDPETGFARPLLDREEVDKAVRAVVLASAYNEARARTDGVDAVMKLARPMPTREQIARALSTHYHDPVFGCECTPTRDDYTKEELDGGWPEHLAEIVLALLNGTDDQTTKE